MNHPQRTQFPGPDTLPARPRALRTLTLALLVALGAVSAAPDVAMAQRRGAGLPNDLKTARDAKPRQPEIEKFVAAQVKGLQNAQAPAEQQAARDALGRESMAVGGAASPSYQLVYSTVVNKQLQGLAKSTDPRVRLNAAIALHRVALNTKSPALAEAAATFVADPSAATALWGAKAAQSILPTLAQGGKPSKLGAAVVQGARRHIDQPDLVDEAYRAVTLDYPNKGQQLTPEAVPAVLPDVMRLVETRVKFYISGVPPSPRIDRDGAIFLTSGRVWGHPAAAKHHATIVQQLTNLAGLAAQHAAAREDDASRKRFTELMRQIGSALSVVATNLKDDKLQAAAKALSESGPQMDNEDLSARADAVYDLLKVRFKTLKPAPTIESSAADDDAEPVTETPPADADGGDSDEAPADDEGEEAAE